MSDWVKWSLSSLSLLKRETLTKEEVSSFCEKNLPRYKRPRYIFFDQVPRSPSGKIEKPKLREKYGKPTG